MPREAPVTTAMRGVREVINVEAFVMPGLVPGIHVLALVHKDVDGRDKPGHDACCESSDTVAITNSDLPGRTTGT